MKGKVIQMEVERLRHLYDEVLYHLEHAPSVDDCSHEENELYEEMANLKNALEDFGIDKVPSPSGRKFERTKKEKKMEEKRLRKLIRIESEKRKRELIHIRSYETSLELKEIGDIRFFELNGDWECIYASAYDHGDPEFEAKLDRLIQDCANPYDVMKAIYSGKCEEKYGLEMDTYTTYRE